MQFKTQVITIPRKASILQLRTFSRHIKKIVYRCCTLGMIKSKKKDIDNIAAFPVSHKLL